jgi:chemotaxis protein methyltransferase CheR
MNSDAVDLIRAVVHARSGAILDPDKIYLIESRLAPVARREGFPAIEDLIGAIRVQRDERLMWAVTEALTSAETAFFRDRVPFQQFREVVLPQLAISREGKPIRVLSAACATGQEAYSLAMIVDDEQSKYPGERIELFGSDLSARCLEKAQSGLYTQFEVQRGLPIRMLVRHFEKADEMWALSPRIRQMVRWRRINLLADLRTLGQFDAIFCRNVISGFDPVTRRRVLEQLARALPPDGFLVLGMNETVGEATVALRPIEGHPGLYGPNPAHEAVAA